MHAYTCNIIAMYIGGAFTMETETTYEAGDLGLDIKLVAGSIKFLADTIERSSEVEVETRKRYAIQYDNHNTSCSDW
jgi:hypothetical protein